MKAFKHFSRIYEGALLIHKLNESDVRHVHICKSTNSTVNFQIFESLASTLSRSPVKLLLLIKPPCPFSGGWTALNWNYVQTKPMLLFFCVELTYFNGSYFDRCSTFTEESVYDLVNWCHSSKYALVQIWKSYFPCIDSSSISTWWAVYHLHYMTCSLFFLSHLAPV